MVTFAFFGTDSFVPLGLTDARGQSTFVAGLALTTAVLGWTAAAWVQQHRIHTDGPRRLVSVGQRISTVGLLGTRYTMEQDFLRRAYEAHGVEVLVPDEPDRTTVHDVIYDELVVGRVEPASRAAYVAVVDRLVARGVGGVVAGCTEIELLLGPDDVAVPYFPSTRLHALAAVEAALAP